jgi:ADP-ribosylglycohydrolase
MQQSLLTKLQGGLTGMYIAQKVRMAYSEGHGPSEENFRQQQKNAFKNYALLAGASVESIIHCRSVNIEDWTVATNRLLEGDGHGIAIVPIAMYLHDDVPLLQSTIQAIGDRYHLDKITVDSLLFLGTALAYMLGDRATPETLIPKVLESLPGNDSRLADQLKLVHECAIESIAERPSTISEMIATISQRQQPYILPVAMASYCFLCTPTNYKLAIQRSAQIPRQPFVTLAMTGILVGTYNGLVAVPPSWYAEGLRGADQLMQSAERLLATWAGLYQPGGQSLPGVVAAPGIMQRRDRPVVP